MKRRSQEWYIGLHRIRKYSHRKDEHDIISVADTPLPAVLVEPQRLLEEHKKNLWKGQSEQLEEAEVWHKRKFQGEY